MRVDLDGLAEICDGSIEIALVAISETPIDVDADLAGIDPDGLAEVGNGAFRVTLFLVSAATEAIGKSNIRTKGIFLKKSRAALDLVNFERHQARLVFGVNF